MFADQLSAAIAGAYGLAPLQALSSAIWKGYSAGSISETDAQTLAEQIEASKRDGVLFSIHDDDGRRASG